MNAAFRVPDAVQRSSRCSAEPGPYQTPAFVTAPALQRTASQELRAARRPGHETSLQHIELRLFVPRRINTPLTMP